MAIAGRALAAAAPSAAAPPPGRPTASRSTSATSRRCSPASRYVRGHQGFEIPGYGPAGQAHYFRQIGGFGHAVVPGTTACPKLSVAGLHVLETEAALDAEVAARRVVVVRRGDLDDLVVL